MELHRIAQNLVSQRGQNGTLFMTTMDIHEVLPVFGIGSVCRAGSTTNVIQVAKESADTFIAANVTDKATFRQMLGADNCPDLG